MDAKVGVNGATLTYLYDGANLVQEQSGGSPSANILAGALDEVFTRTDTAGAWSPLFDGLGGTLALTDSTGTCRHNTPMSPLARPQLVEAQTALHHSTQAGKMTARPLLLSR